MGRRVFREYLKQEYSEENLLFWEACEQIKRELCDAPREAVAERARAIYENYISILSPKEVPVQYKYIGTYPTLFISPKSQITDKSLLRAEAPTPTHAQVTSIYSYVS